MVDAESSSKESPPVDGAGQQVDSSVAEVDRSATTQGVDSSVEVANNSPENLDDDAPSADEDPNLATYTPRNIKYYLHDNRNSENDSGGEGGEGEVNEKTISRADGKWLHDRFDPKNQKPKSKHELINRYGYDIRRDGEAKDEDIDQDPSLPSKNSNKVTLPLKEKFQKIKSQTEVPQARKEPREQDTEVEAPRPRRQKPQPIVEPRAEHQRSATGSSGFRARGRAFLRGRGGRSTRGGPQGSQKLEDFDEAPNQNSDTKIRGDTGFVPVSPSQPMFNHGAFRGRGGRAIRGRGMMSARGGPSGRGRVFAYPDHQPTSNYGRGRGRQLRGAHARDSHQESHDVAPPPRVRTNINALNSQQPRRGDQGPTSKRYSAARPPRQHNDNASFVPRQPTSVVYFDPSAQSRPQNPYPNRPKKIIDIVAP